MNRSMRNLMAEDFEQQRARSLEEPVGDSYMRTRRRASTQSDTEAGSELEGHLGWKIRA